MKNSLKYIFALYFLVIGSFTFAKTSNETISQQYMGINSIHFNTFERSFDENRGHSVFRYIATTLTEGNTYYFYINGYGYDQYSSVWIDFNGNNEFEEEEKVVDRLFLSASGEISMAKIAIPAYLKENAANCVRVKTEYAFSNTHTVDCPYTDPQYGETQDYFVKIKSNPEIANEISELTKY